MSLRQTVCQSHSKQTVRLFHCQMSRSAAGGCSLLVQGAPSVALCDHGESHSVPWRFHRTLSKASLEFSENMLSAKEKLSQPRVYRQKFLSSAGGTAGTAAASGRCCFFKFLWGFQEKP